MIDLRTDALSRPTDEMWAAMRAAELGWAYFGEDPSVNECEGLAARLLGKEAAVLVPTCTVANLVALMTLGERGSQVVLDPTAHIAASEARGFEEVCGLAAGFVEAPAGCPEPGAIEEAIAEGQRAGRRTTLLCLENSHNNAGGAAVPPARIAAAAAAAHRHSAAVHLDGARLFNVAVALRVPAARLAEAADTVSISLGKGLCAPGGALLAGPRATLDRARLNLRRIGAASVHKAGLLAAAGLVALRAMIGRLEEDNRRARDLATRLAALPGLRLDLATVQTNIVLVDTTPSGLTAEAVVERLARRGVLGLRRSESLIRFVTHRLIGDAEVARAAAAVAASL
ncbi:MAG: aminotransferase class I/II-fold pyridoxal phosphate-dependent enzyme [Candidatus Rokubacteria bacterium]|nr:aminotransferase class I/II-fold pyridoxal phosphate-dependent enzyme [Candidatus Rokubacteria bacterium]